MSLKLPAYEISEESRVEAYLAIVADANAEKKRAHDQSEAAKPENERVEYVDVTADEYWLARCEEIINSYDQQVFQARQHALAEAYKNGDLPEEFKQMILAAAKSAAGK